MRIYRQSRCLCVCLHDHDDCHDDYDPCGGSIVIIPSAYPVCTSRPRLPERKKGYNQINLIDKSYLPAFEDATFAAQLH